jgi:hypothetical protein
LWSGRSSLWSSRHRSRHWGRSARNRGLSGHGGTRSAGLHGPGRNGSVGSRTILVIVRNARALGHWRAGRHIGSIRWASHEARLILLRGSCKRPSRHGLLRGDAWFCRRLAAREWHFPIHALTAEQRIPLGKSRVDVPAVVGRLRCALPGRHGSHVSELSNGSQRPGRDEERRGEQAGESAAVGRCEDHNQTLTAKFHGKDRWM